MCFLYKFWYYEDVGNILRKYAEYVDLLILLTPVYLCSYILCRRMNSVVVSTLLWCRLPGHISSFLRRKSRWASREWEGSMVRKKHVSLNLAPSGFICLLPRQTRATLNPSRSMTCILHSSGLPSWRKQFIAECNVREKRTAWNVYSTSSQTDVLFRPLPNRSCNKVLLI